MYKIVMILLFFSSFCFAQKTEKESIKESVEKLFIGMKNADTAIIKSVFAENAILQTITKNNSVRTEKISEFLLSFSKLSKNDADERISFEPIYIDGNLASVFTPYEFYYKGKFSHCGANSFQMVKQNNVWKIQYLIDTRRTNCKK
ncbi:nuclear transport factor 2 family protein [Chryseobacterium chendengshani]|uniref:nuclear transport factor 2 family protein n=1 Tax=Chryseobacterium sp. LJ668 TaxID=2864040 RepID=UPI001C690567|nr:nuclear transport factor 2 family protein [Chryseobacterium sp. LJ668]MBW8523925.1 nuclear transport factor 2 family protein [Chryseobacterium sp. LJ668]QYK16865.1 nuclear transport factor 2 family protein [Chryseobacterium sp. LJ668]